MTDDQTAVGAANSGTATEWTAIVPMKSFRRSKSRLRSELAASARAKPGKTRTTTNAAAHADAISVAMFRDVLLALTRCPTVSGILVATDDSRVAELARQYEADVLIEDAGGADRDSSLNSVLRQALTAVAQSVAVMDHHNTTLPHGVTAPPVSAGNVPRNQPTAHVKSPHCVIVPADLACLTPHELADALAFASMNLPETSIVRDSHGDGTALLMVSAPNAKKPRFGPGSASKHRKHGAHNISKRVQPGLRIDVDTLENLRRALKVGVGPNLRELAAELDLSGK